MKLPPNLFDRNLSARSCGCRFDIRFWSDWYSFSLIMLEPLFIPAMVDSGATRHPGASSTTGTSAVKNACTETSFRGLRCLRHFARGDERRIESYQEKEI